MKYIFYFFLIILFGIATNPSAVSAAELRFDISKKEVSQRQEFALELLLDAEGEMINALEAEITYPNDTIRLVAIHDGNSIIPLWVEKPRDDNGKIKFSGIIPGGFNGMIDPLSYPKLYPARVLKFIFVGDHKGIGEINIGNVHVFRADGKGTEVTVTTKPLLVNVTSYVLDEIYHNEDDIAPEFELVAVEPKGVIFPDHSALLFLAEDKETGIREYQVKIGDQAWVTAQSPYELEDSMFQKNISVKAIDNAGNEKVSEVELPSVMERKAKLIGLVILIVIIIGCVVYFI